MVVEVAKQGVAEEEEGEAVDMAPGINRKSPRGKTSWI